MDKLNRPSREERELKYAAFQKDFDALIKKHSISGYIFLGDRSIGCYVVYRAEDEQSFNDIHTNIKSLAQTIETDYHYAFPDAW